MKSYENVMEESNLTHQELNRLFDISSQRVNNIQSNCLLDSKQLAIEAKNAINFLRIYQKKIVYLKQLEQSAVSRGEKQIISSYVSNNEKQLRLLQKKLKDCTSDIQKKINNDEKKILLTSSGIKKRSAQLETISKERTCRLKDLVGRISEQLEQSEDAMSSLVHSSSVLGQTQAEFENQAGHIKTGSKLLSKYEQRELTEKILLFLSLLLYFAVVYYILQKRLLLLFLFF